MTQYFYLLAFKGLILQFKLIMFNTGDNMNYSLRNDCNITAFVNERLCLKDVNKVFVNNFLHNAFLHILMKYFEFYKILFYINEVYNFQNSCVTSSVYFCICSTYCCNWRQIQEFIFHRLYYFPFQKLCPMFQVLFSEIVYWTDI